MKIYTIPTAEGEKQLFVDSATISYSIDISNNDILLLFFDNDCNVIFEKHYTSWKSCNIASGKLIKKYMKIRKKGEK